MPFHKFAMINQWLVFLAFVVSFTFPAFGFGQTTLLAEDFESVESTATEIISPMEREAGTYQTTATVPGWLQTGEPSQFIKVNGVSGNTALILNEFGDSPNTLSREITGLVPGATYRLTFEYWGDNCGPCGYSFEWEVNGEVFPVSEGAFQTNSGNFHTVTHEFLALSSSTTVRFSETSTSSGSPVFDNILIAALDQPSVTDLTPIAYYPLDGSGEEVTGNNIDLDSIGAPAYVASLAPGLGQALSADGIDDALIGAGYNPSLTGRLTLSAWVRAETRAVWGSIFKNWNGQFHFGIDNGLAGSGSSGKLSNYINLDGVSGQPYVVAPELFPINEWIHTAVVVDSVSQTQKLYINGALVGSNTFSGALRTNPCTGLGIAVKPNCAGTDESSPPGYWHGELDEVTAWDVALSDAQIAELYDLGIAGTPLIVTNEPPVANPGLSIETSVGETVQVSGLGSTDDSTAPTNLIYSWALKSAPGGSLASLSSSSSSSTSLRPDLPGTFVIELVVTDEQGADSLPAEMEIAAGLEPAFVFTKIFEGGSYYFRDADGYASESDYMWRFDAENGRALFNRHSYLYAGDFTSNSFTWSRVQNLEEYDGVDFHTTLTAEAPSGISGFYGFSGARITGNERSRVWASYPDPENGHHLFGLFDVTSESVDQVSIPQSIDGYRVHPDPFLSRDSLDLSRGYGTECIQTRVYEYSDGRIHEYCSVYARAVFEIGENDINSVLDNSSVLPPSGGVFVHFSQVEREIGGDLLFLATVSDDEGRYSRDLFRYPEGGIAEPLVPGGTFAGSDYSGIYEFLPVEDAVLFQGYTVAGSLYDQGLFEIRDGLVSEKITYQNSAIYPFGFRATDGAIATWGYLQGDSDGSSAGVYWLEDGNLRKVATRGEAINGTDYDWIGLDGLWSTFDERSITLRAQRQVLYQVSTDSHESEWQIDNYVARFDTDRDGVGDDVDNCPQRPNEDQLDSDSNGIGDICEDSDGDSWLDVEDNCPLVSNASQSNLDGDNYGDACDLCPNTAGESQSDLDEDGAGDICDSDIDGDGFENLLDNCPLVANNQLDLDSDNIGDACDPDIDGDGIDNAVDGHIADGTFVDESEVPSSEFTDFRQGGVSFGRIVNSGGLTLRISDAPDGSDGLLIEAPTGSGQARIRQCDYRGRDAVLDLVQGSVVRVTCGSIEVDPLFGHAFLLLDDEILIEVPAESEAKLLDTGSSDVTLTVEGPPGVPVTMVLNDDTQVLLEGSSIANVFENLEGQYVVENDPTSASIITVVRDGIVLDYLPGDRGHLVAIDIKPGSEDNSINLGSNGVVPVAIFGSDDFNATDIDPLTVELASSEVRLRGRGTPSATVSDVDGDGIDDLVVQVETENLVLQPTDSTAKLTGSTHSGVDFIGEDIVTIVPED